MTANPWSNHFYTNMAFAMDDDPSITTAVMAAAAAEASSNGDSNGNNNTNDNETIKSKMDNQANNNNNKDDNYVNVDLNASNECITNQPDRRESKKVAASSDSVDGKNQQPKSSSHLIFKDFYPEYRRKADSWFFQTEYETFR